MINLPHSSITNPLYAPQNVTFLSIKSSHLQGRGEVSIYLPESARGMTHLPFVILLHGVYGSHFSWLYQAGAHLVLEKLITEKKMAPMMLVMPSDGLTGDGSGYLTHLSKDHEKWIIEDVVEAVNHHFQEVDADSPAFISGLSMGGYGALRLGMKYHHLFSGISAHSSITDLNDLQTFIDEDIRQVLNEETIESSSIIYNAKKYRNSLPVFRFDCGANDQLIDSNRKLHAALLEEKIEHLYQEFEGAHTYEYWTKHIEDSFIFFNSLL